jgi:hypothetical protein
MPWGDVQQRPLFVLRNANMQSTSDQPFVKQGTFTRWIPRRVMAVRNGGGATGTCAGGIYSASAKGGNALVAAGQSWNGLSGAGKMVDATIAAVGLTDSHTQTPVLSLTNGSTAAVTADLFIFGDAIP